MQPFDRPTKPLPRDLFRREEARLALMRSRWRDLIGEALSTRVVPASFDGATLRLRPDGPRSERAATALAPDLAQRLRNEVPEAGVSVVEVLPAETRRVRVASRGSVRH
jgi:hypothetical protein